MNAYKIKFSPLSGYYSVFSLEQNCVIRHGMTKQDAKEYVKTLKGGV